MNRSNYYDYINEKLNTLALRINSNGKLNILNLHVHSENFYLHFFNELYGWKLENLNNILQNVESIDLIDHSNKYIIQVSATNQKSKIESSLNKKIIQGCSNYYTFKFISITNDASNLRKKTYKNPHNIKFDPSNDIYDITSILNDILSLNIDDQKKIYKFIKKELGNDVDIIKLDSNLAKIINILSKEDLSNGAQINVIKSFEIERKIEYNQLNKTKLIINDYSIHYSRLDKIYDEFDKQGVNNSYSVHQNIRTTYVEKCIKLKNKNSDNLFLEVIESVKNKIIQSANYVQIPIDELELCVHILVVDAFIRCKIFKNPED